MQKILLASLLVSSAYSSSVRSAEQTFLNWYTAVSAGREVARSQVPVAFDQGVLTLDHMGGLFSGVGLEEIFKFSADKIPTEPNKKQVSSVSNLVVYSLESSDMPSEERRRFSDVFADAFVSGVLAACEKFNKTMEPALVDRGVELIFRAQSLLRKRTASLEVDSIFAARGQVRHEIFTPDVMITNVLLFHGLLVQEGNMSPKIFALDVRLLAQFRAPAVKIA